MTYNKTKFDPEDITSFINWLEYQMKISREKIDKLYDVHPINLIDSKAIAFYSGKLIAYQNIMDEIKYDVKQSDVLDNKNEDLQEVNKCPDKPLSDDEIEDALKRGKVEAQKSSWRPPLPQGFRFK